MTPAEKAVEAARKVLEDFGVRGPPVPVERMVRARNIVLQFAPLGQELSGMAYVKDGLAIIGVNALHHPNRQRFSIAHEFAHHILHRPMIENAVHVDKEFRVLHRDKLASEGVDQVEIEANAFASELLMPSQFLVAALDEVGLDIEDDAQIEALAKKFRVSPAAIRFRLARSF